jgi:His/Glu/Gln/Arg/opine family amino acid ABC transporter permease subunit
VDQSTLDLLKDSLVPFATGLVKGTIPLTLASFPIGLVIALVVALMRLSSVRVLQGVARLYVSIIRGTPLLVQLFLIYYALPEFGVTWDPFPSAVVAFSLNVGGYASEVVRAAILSVPRGQTEAARHRQDPGERGHAQGRGDRRAHLPVLRPLQLGRALLLGRLPRAVVRPDPRGDASEPLRGEVNVDLLEVRGLHKSFGDHHVLRGIDAHVAPGSVTVLIGPSGSGKTTVLGR